MENENISESALRLTYQCTLCNLGDEVRIEKNSESIDW